LVGVAATIAIAVISWRGSLYTRQQVHMQDGVVSLAQQRNSNSSGSSSSSSQQRGFDCPGGYWGVGVDGRNAVGGRCAYSCKYATEIEHDLDTVYSMLQNESLPLNRLAIEHWEAIKHVLGKDWHSNRYNPVSNEIAYCHARAYDAAQAAKVMANITTVNSSTYEFILKADFKAVVADLFEVYNQRVREAGTSEELLEVLADLLRNLAFLHPLHDRNGRSRMLLLQFELRRLRLGCGTLMFNNNKNIYFDTPEAFVAKIKEGMQVYEEAQASGFESNPWESVPTLYRHFSKFPMPETGAALEACWRLFCKPQPNPVEADLEQMEFEAAGMEQDMKRRLHVWNHHHPTPHPYEHPSHGCAGTSPF